MSFGFRGQLARSTNLRILTVLVAAIAIFGIVDGSLWRGLLTPSIAYRPAMLFALSLVFGWRGFVWSQLLSLAAFSAFLGWRGAVFVTPLYILSQGLGMVVARRFAGDQPWLSSERSTIGLLAGVAIAPAVPAFFGSPFYALVGLRVGPPVPAAFDSWLRGAAGILAVTPAVLVFCCPFLREWVGLPTQHERRRLAPRDLADLGVETALWSATLWLSVYFKAHYGLNITYLTFVAPLSLTLLRGLGLATLTLASNAIAATTLWQALHWAGTFSAMDLRLLIATYSITVLVLAAVVEERQRSRGQVAKLLAAEAALRASEERFRLAIKATNEAIWDIDLKSGKVTWNDTYSELFGRPEAEHSLQFWIDHIHPDDRTRIVDDFQAAIDGGASSWGGEYRFRRVNGQWANLHDRAYIARDGSGVAWRVIGSMQDLTQQKQAEAAVRESEERFRRVFEEGPLGLALLGRDYRFHKVNSALCRMLDYTEAELLQKTFADITHPDDLRADVELAERLFRRELPFYRLQKRYVKKAGDIIWISLTASLILAADGTPLHGLAMVEDVTEMKRAQEEALVRQKLESLGTLAGGIAHDFNNLLGAIQAQAELAENEIDAGSSCKGELKAIRDVAIRGSEIVHQLIIYAGKENVTEGSADVSRTVDEMLALLKVSVTKHAAIHADLAQDLPLTRASAAQLRQLVMNLITNASEAIGMKDGVIRVSTRRVTLTRQSAASLPSALPDGEYVQLEVADTGCGMSLATQANLFDPFFSTKSSGRGLGMAVVQGIVRNVGGAIQFTSEADQGTAFQVLLPCAETPSVASIAVSQPEEFAPQTQVATILVVDDEDNLRLPVAKMLRKNGYEVLEAADGTLAIDVLREHGSKIDAILLDMTLPGASSREIVAEAAKAKAEIKVVLMSAYSREMVEGAVKAPQIRDFIRKPFRFGDLLTALRNALS